MLEQLQFDIDQILKQQQNSNLNCYSFLLSMLNHNLLKYKLTHRIQPQFDTVQMQILLRLSMIMHLLFAVTMTLQNQKKCICNHLLQPQFGIVQKQILLRTASSQLLTVLSKMIQNFENNK